MSGWCKKGGVGIKEKQPSLPKLNSHPAPSRKTLAWCEQEPCGVVSALYRANVSSTLSFSKSSRTGK